MPGGFFDTEGYEGWDSYQRFTGMEGFPMVGEGPVGMLTSLFGGSMITGMMGGVNMMPMGLQGRDQNLYDRFRSQQFTQAHDDAVRRMAERDRVAYSNLFRGITNTVGVDYGQRQARGGDVLASGLVNMSPLLAQMAPNVLDAMSGYQGSAAVMTHYMMLAGRHRRDPLTGYLGQGADWIAGRPARGTEPEQVGIAGGVFDELYAGKGWQQMSGMPAGQMGQMYLALSRMGMIPGATKLEDLAANRNPALEKAMRDKGMGGMAMSDLSGAQKDQLLKSPEVVAELKSFDSRRVAGTLKGWSESIQAMKEIFGDAGHPDAPMPALITAINHLTAGGMSQLDPGQVNMMVRSTYNLAKQSGIGMEGAAMLQQQATERAMQMGLNPVLANQAVQHAMAFQAAYQNEGMGAYSSWGKGDMNRHREMSQRSMLNALSSRMGNQLGALARLNDTNAFEKGSDAEKMINAALGGSTTFVGANGKMDMTAITNNQMAEIIAAGSNRRISPVQAMMALKQQRDANQEYLSQHEEFGQTVVKGQPKDMARFHTYVLGNQAAGVILSQVGKAGTVNEREALARGLGGAMQRALEQMSPGELADNNLRRKAIGDALKEELQSTPYKNNAAAQALLTKFAGDPALTDFTRTTGEQFFANLDAVSRARGHGGIKDLYTVHSQQMIAMTGQAHAQARVDAMYQQAFSPLSNNDMLRRAVQGVMDSKTGDPDALKKVVSQAFGGVRGEQVAEAMGDQFENLRKLQAGFEAARKNAQTPRGAEESANDYAVRLARTSNPRAIMETAENYEARIAKLVLKRESGEKDEDYVSRLNNGVATDLKTKSMAIRTANTQLIQGLESKGLYLGAQTTPDELEAILGKQARFEELRLEKKSGNIDLNFLDKKTRKSLEDLSINTKKSTSELLTMAPEELDKLSKTLKLSKDDLAPVREVRQLYDERMSGAAMAEWRGYGDAGAKLIKDEALMMRIGGSTIGLKYTVRDASGVESEKTQSTTVLEGAQRLSAIQEKLESIAQNKGKTVADLLRAPDSEVLNLRAEGAAIITASGNALFGKDKSGKLYGYEYLGADKDAILKATREGNTSLQQLARTTDPTRLKKRIAESIKDPAMRTKVEQGVIAYQAHQKSYAEAAQHFRDEGRDTMVTSLMTMTGTNKFGAEAMVGEMEKTQGAGIAMLRLTQSGADVGATARVKIRGLAQAVKDQRGDFTGMKDEDINRDKQLLETYGLVAAPQRDEAGQIKKDAKGRVIRHELSRSDQLMAFDKAAQDIQKEEKEKQKEEQAIHVKIATLEVIENGGHKPSAILKSGKHGGV